MGEVYRGRDPRIGREVAIKVLPESFSKDPERLHRFEREARSTGVLNHPNVVVVYDVGSHDGSPYIVSELLEGETLRALLAGSEALPLAMVVDYACQIARGLAAAHEKGIVHRDLKPENLFVTRDERVKILDFGLAKLTQPETPASDIADTPTVSAVTEAGVTLGTLGYMSPEQVRGLPADARSDIFSFGAVFYEMLTGKRAFRGSSPAETMSMILKEQPSPIGEANPDAPPGLDRVVRRCLEKNPANRFHSANDVAFALTDASTETAAPTAFRRPAFPRRSILPVIAAAAVLVIGFLLWQRLPRSGPAQPQRFSSLAVLPLVNFSRDPEQEYFSDGMTEALISRLAQVGSVRVISRTSVMQYKGTKKPLRQIAKELGVDGIIEGSVMRAGDRVRVTAQLISAKNDEHLWAHDYERDLRDVLSLQSEVAQAVAQEIQAKLTRTERERLASARPVDAQAHEAYLRGRYSLNKGSEASIRKAIEYFHQAISRDSGYARAWAGLADSYSALRSVYEPPRVVMPKAEAAALKAVQLEDTLAEAHVSLGFVRMFWNFDWPGAEREFRRAIDLNPGLADAHDGYGGYLTAVGRYEEAIAEQERAAALDPLSLLILTDAAWAHYFAGHYETAAEWARKALDLDPNYTWARIMLGVNHEKMGRFDEAIAELQKAHELDSSPTMLEFLGGTYAAAGRKEEARKVVAELTARAQKRYVCPYEIATVFVGLGDKDAAFRWLEKGREERADCMPWMKGDAKLDPVRSDPRYREILHRMGLDNPGGSAQ